MRRVTINAVGASHDGDLLGATTSPLHSAIAPDVDTAPVAVRAGLAQISVGAPVFYYNSFTFRT